jgi:acetolactate synthase I/II/III large subunit
MVPSMQRTATRIGGHVVAESLRALGADVVFGLPGVHVLPIWEGMRDAELRVLGFRQELNAAFAADGYARSTGRPAPLVVSTGPGAFMTIAPLLEAANAFVPVVVIASQIRSDAIGKGHGHLHESPDQAASFAPLVKWVARATSAEEIPSVLAEAWRRASTPPQGPVYVEVPYDVLRAPAESASAADLDPGSSPRPVPDADELDRAAALLESAERPVLIAGGGAVRSGAGEALLQLAMRLDAPVATTYTGKGVFPERHPLALGSVWDDPAHRQLLTQADVVLCVGSWLGYDLTDSFHLRLEGTLVQVDAAPERIGVNYPALGLVGDARATLEALLERVASLPAKGGEARVAAVRESVAGRLTTDPGRVAVDLLETIEATLPAGAAAAWDSTILAYAACWYLRTDDPRRFLYPAGSSTLGYAFPAALGAAAAAPDAPALAVVGDGGFQYGTAELATAVQHGLSATLLLVDDGGYGILREYQDASGYANAGVDLRHPDFGRLCEAYGLPTRASSADALPADLEWALAQPRPTAVILEEVLAMPDPSA